MLSFAALVLELESRELFEILWARRFCGEIGQDARDDRRSSFLHGGGKKKGTAGVQDSQFPPRHKNKSKSCLIRPIQWVDLPPNQNIAREKDHMEKLGRPNRLLVNPINPLLNPNGSASPQLAHNTPEAASVENPRYFPYVRLFNRCFVFSSSVIWKLFTLLYATAVKLPDIPVRWYLTIPSLDQWWTAIENHRYQWLHDPKTIEELSFPMVASNHSIQWWWFS